MSTPYKSFNNFGASVEKLLEFFPGVYLDAARICDLGSESNMIEALGRAAREVGSLLKSEIYNRITAPDLEKIVREGEAVDGQTVLQLGLKPVVGSSVHLWIKPTGDFIGVGVGSSYWYQYWDKKPRLGYGEVRASDFSVDANTGAITLLNGVSLSNCDVVYATYRVDVNSELFNLPSCADWCYMLAAVDLGSRSYQQDAPSVLLGQYAARANMIKEQLVRGHLIPEEIRYLNYYHESDRNEDKVRSIRSRRV